MSNKKAVAVNTLSQIIGKIITGGTTFLISIIIARSLGAGGYGDFTKVTTFVAFFYLFADFGLNAAYLEIAEKRAAASILLALRTIMGLLLVFLCLAILVFLPGTETEGYTPFVKIGIILYSISILFQSFITTANAFFQKALRYDFSTYALAIGSGVTLLFVFFLPTFHLEHNLFFVLAAFLLGTILSAITALFFAKKITPSLSLTFDIPTALSLLKTTLPLGLTLLCNVVYFHADSVILTLTRTSTEVGIYGFAYKLFEFPLVLPTFFMNAAFPFLLSSTTSGDQEGLMRKIKQSAGVLFSFSIIIFLCGFLTAPLLTLVKDDFAASILPFRILLVGLPIFYLTSVTMWTLVALKKRTILLGIYILSMIINIGSNILFVPAYGYLAAAWITVGSELFVLLASYLVIQKQFQSQKTELTSR